MSAPDRRIGWLFLCVALLYAAYLACHMAPYAGGADSSGYLNSARLLAHGRANALLRPLPDVAGSGLSPSSYQPLGFRVLGDQQAMVPTYPVGLPLHLAAAAFVAGWDHAPTLVNLAAALAAGGLLYAIGRRLALPPLWAAAGVPILWLCPLFLFMALQPMSDLLAVTWTLAALYAALRAGEGWRWCLACGFFVSVAVLVRPTNLLLAVPVAVAFGLKLPRYLWAVLGGLPAAAFLALYNHRLYGAVFTTGYGDVSGLFSREFFPHIAAHFAQWVPQLLTPMVIIAAFAAPFAARSRSRDFAVLAAWAIVLIGLYSFYYHSGETWWYLRFILPAFPVLILAALLGPHQLWEKWRAWRAWRWPRLVIAVALMGAVLVWEHHLGRRLAVTDLEQQEGTYPASAQWAAAHLPANAVIFCMQVSGALFYYTDLVLVRWDLLQPADRDRLMPALERQALPAYAVLYPFELEDGALQRLGGQWKKLATLRAATVWERVPSTPP